MIKRTLILGYAGVAYLLALANIAYIVGFLADFGVPKGINDGATGTLWTSIAVNLGLIWLFGLHHSATARLWFKARWTRIVLPALERATYLYMTAAATAFLVIFWRPIPITVWEVQNGIAYWTVWAAFLAVWAMMFSATFHFGHLEFFGLAQAWSRITGRAPAATSFCARWLYGIVRHPISIGWMLAPWLTPHMTVGQLTFAAGATVYVLIATMFEEADLVADLGDVYRRYRAEVPAFFPGLSSGRAGSRSGRIPLEKK
jgi:protein-S-isoprenylcysteine O-methyltransferase Ste14